jgi:hypothetical protein
MRAQVYEIFDHPPGEETVNPSFHGQRINSHVSDAHERNLKTEMASRPKGTSDTRNAQP